MSLLPCTLKGLALPRGEKWMMLLEINLNMQLEQVIPYIASHYRKDKIWSESNCGNVAIEALVTVCRAMSQLEVGQLAVASFGKKGNIKLLHDFNQPFTGETGMQMISSLMSQSLTC